MSYNSSNSNIIVRLVLIILNIKKTKQENLNVNNLINEKIFRLYFYIDHENKCQK